ncbi:MAG: hypothetical protein WBC17_12310 [Mycobacterium sp.]
MVRVLACAVVMVALGCGLNGSGTATADPGDPSVPSPPGSLIEEGTFAVGTDIAPGVYASAGPVEGDTCYWRRIGADNVTLNNALTSQPQLIAIEATDVAFKTRGCQPWQLTQSGIPPEEIPPWLAQLRLRHELNVLNGLAGASGNGQLPF